MHFPSQAALSGRLGQHWNSKLREHGFQNEADFSDWKKRMEALEKEDAERQRAAMSEQERLRADATAAQERATAAETELARSRFEAHVGGVCARLGVTNVDYAMYEVERAARATPDVDLDVEAHLRGMLGNDQAKAALGIAAPPVVQPVPAITSPAGGAPVPAPPPPGGAPAQNDAMAMSSPDFQKHLERMGVGLPGS